jgi:hypothetical protein
MAERGGGRVRAPEVYVFDEQIGRDDGLAARRRCDDGGVVADTVNKG